MNFGYQILDYFIGEYNLKENIKIGGKSFNSEQLDVFLSQRNFRIEPKLSLIIEKSRRISFLISAGYNYQLDENKGVHFYENNKFFLFRKKAFIANGDDNLLIDSIDGNILKNRINISAGISIKLR